MEEQTPNPPIMPQSANPPVYGPVGSTVNPPQSPPPANSKTIQLPKFSPIWIVGGVIVILLIVTLIFATRRPAQVTVAPTPTPTQVPTPTATRTVAQFATGSAFTTFETTVNNFPTVIQNAVIQDQTTTPPVLTLPLGF